jgi:hypothetical protein
MFGQSDDLKFFGYFQNNFTHYYLKFNGANPTTFWESNSFVMQQMNLFAQKNFGQEFSAFVNLEITNSLSSKDNFGAIDIEEAWLKYSPSEYLNIKFGLLVPRFNNFNEIKNRTVLLPYIYRPTIYETVFNSYFNCEEYVPQQAYAQIYGDIPVVGDVRFNYAAFMGNLQNDQLIQNSSPYAIANDTSKYKMYGGRLGVEYNNLAFGVSGTWDHKNFWNYGIGYVPRTRFGAYINYSLAGFEFETEYINVKYSVSAGQEAILQAAPFNPYSPTPTGFDKQYFHWNLLYNITDQVYAYAGYDYIKSQDLLFSISGVHQYNFGAGYRVNSSIVIKAQFDTQNSEAFGTPLLRQDYLVGASVYF